LRRVFAARAKVARTEAFLAGTSLAAVACGGHGARSAAAAEDAMDGLEPLADGFDSVTGYLGSDHHRLDEALRFVSKAVNAGHFDDAAAAYREFELGSLRHLRIEEELLFPVFEARSGIVNGPTAVMRDEHRQLRAALVLMRAGLLASDVQAFGDGLRFFHSVLPDHNSKEEHILYPALDSLLRPSERARLIERLQREWAA
jgi:hemerythrin-like domain-containing protein